MPATDQLAPAPPTSRAGSSEHIGPDLKNPAQDLWRPFAWHPEHPDHTCAVHRGFNTWQCQEEDCDASGQLPGNPSGDGVRTVPGLTSDDGEATPESIAVEAPLDFGRSATAVRTEVPEEVDWYVPGFIAPGWATKLAGREKVGKGKLIAYLLGTLERREPTAFGPAASEPVKSLIYTEEPVEAIREKLDDFDVKSAWVVHTYELAGVADWRDKAQLLVEKAVELGAKVIFVDNISKAAGIEDENGVELARAAECLVEKARARDARIACLFDHHHKKGGASTENRSRGGTALAGAMDINVELDRVASDRGDRRRKLSALGRVRASNWEKTVELEADHSGYRLLSSDGSGDAPAPARDKHERELLRVLEEADGWLATSVVTRLARGNNAELGQTLREMSESATWPVVVKTQGKSILYRYDEDAQAAFVREATAK